MSKSLNRVSFHIIFIDIITCTYMWGYKTIIYTVITKYILFSSTDKVMFFRHWKMSLLLHNPKTWIINNGLTLTTSRVEPCFTSKRQFRITLTSRQITISQQNSTILTIKYIKFELIFHSDLCETQRKTNCIKLSLSVVIYVQQWSSVG